MLVGLGLGPGDPELLTLRAVRLLKSADRVFVPGKLAYDLVAPYAKAEILDFPMTRDESIIKERMRENALKIAPTAKRGLAVLGILGDPNFFSTFSRLCEVMKEMYPDVESRTEPGISAITAFASAAGVSISEGFTVADGREPKSMILLKVRRPAEAVERLKREGYTGFTLVERMYMNGERVYTRDFPETGDYFSVLYARR
ncbi:cobalt-factor II C20-methyltransferase [Methanocella conradii HZ254]|uniref:Cobalt-factor II C20-methyltransferase n=1 Tax=Methanocella conradii (strain DSM 24694 / JCM 17849 / CGMCC 1.5162 / HZ254) TaxID=1041930 RepID=H8IAR4_METCZ|nr:cobalt-factor II C(20)-methyltransferase [Methanocella conradii]AFD00569.1 cobalt-factor II C20-methyltransferase [Methanocella conradii HZ254]